MPSTYSTRLRFELIATGEKSGTWGDTTNTNLGTLIEEAIAGVAAVVMASDANYTLTANNGSTDEARRAVLSVTSSASLTATRDVIVPTQTKLYAVYNNTTGGQSIRVIGASGTGITIPSGKKRLVYHDGTNVVDMMNDLPSGATVNGSAFGTAAFVADSSLAHLAGTETVSGAKTFSVLSQHKYSSTQAGADASGSATTNVGHRIGASNVGSGGYGIDVGVSNADGTTWIQSRDWSNFATNTTLRLQPNGGAVHVGGNLVYHAGNIGTTSHAFSVAQDFSATISVPNGDTSIKNRASSGWIGIVGHSGGFGTAGAGSIIVRASGGVEHYIASTRVFNANSSSVDVENVPLNVQGARANVSGKQAIPIPAFAMTPQTTNGAATGLTETTTNKVMVSSLDFDQSTVENAQFSMAMPKSWNESTVSVQFLWTATTTGDVVWGMEAVALSDDDAVDAAFGSAVNVTDSVTAANDLMISSESSALTIGGSPSEGDIVVFRVFRLASSGSDTLAADAKLVSIRLFITTNAANDA